MQLCIELHGPNARVAAESLATPNSGIQIPNDDTCDDLRTPLRSAIGEIVQVVGILVNAGVLVATLLSLKQRVIIVRIGDAELRITGDESPKALERDIALLGSSEEDVPE